MKIKFVVAAAIIMALSISNTNAQVAPNKPTSNQRIKQGIKSGELTKSETKNLVRDQKEIRQDVKSAKSDGILTGDEKKEIRKDQRQASREIYRKKHNKRDRD